MGLTKQSQQWGEEKKKSLKCNSSLDVTKLKMSLGLPLFKIQPILDIFL